MSRCRGAPSLRFYEAARHWKLQRLPRPSERHRTSWWSKSGGDGRKPGLCRARRGQAQMVIAAPPRARAGRRRRTAESRGPVRRGRTAAASYDPQYPLLYSGRGYQYCDLISRWDARRSARPRGAALEIRGERRFLLLRSARCPWTGPGLALMSQQTAFAGSAIVMWRGFASSEAVEGLRGAGQNGYVARGLIARSAFRRSLGDWDGAARDLDEADEFAEPGPMRLYLCDLALERARLALARRETFAPLNGPPRRARRPFRLTPPLPPRSETRRGSNSTAAQADLECGYRRRDEELAELDAVVAGRAASPSCRRGCEGNRASSESWVIVSRLG